MIPLTFCLSLAASLLDPGSAALFTWADFDGDLRLDLAAVGPAGNLQLLANAGDGRFEDVTEERGLAGVGNAALALWVDYDADGRLDLFVGAREGPSHLFHNDGEVFVDVGRASGLSSEGPVLSAHWLDHDGDGRLDLHVVTAGANELYRGLEGGFFEALELPAFVAPRMDDLSMSERGAPSEEPPSSAATPGKGGAAGEEPEDDRTPADEPRRGGSAPVALGPTITSASLPPPINILGCSSAIKDQASPGSCVQASTTPTLGLLYPISSNLFVAVGGNVGLGTTSPVAKLDVAGTARITDTLTLAPSGDLALDLSTGSLYKAGALFMHTKGTLGNTALGSTALQSVGTGLLNTASGYRALSMTTAGSENTASGANALLYNRFGNRNSALGAGALFSNTTGSNNTACGVNALFSNDGSYNTATGQDALAFNTSGSKNAANGAGALYSNTSGDENTASGSGALRSNTTGFDNTASGALALYSNTAGVRNTADGHGALYFNTTGGDNMASGALALRSNTTGGNNTASGVRALYSNTTGFSNTACGVQALARNTTGHQNMAGGIRALYRNTTGSDNTAFGYRALYLNTTGERNVAIGYRAGLNLAGSDNIAIGHQASSTDSGTTRIGTSGAQTRAFIAGIRGVTTGIANAIPVLVDSNGQLGTVSSSRRFKEEIQDMGDATERLLELRPVTFRYKPEVQAGERPLEYGLIAEEVAEVFPELVVYDEEGQPFTVKYHLLAPMLLNEVERLHERIEALAEDHARELRALEERLAAFEALAPEALPASRR